MLPRTKRKGKAISIFALSFSVEWNLENFSGSAAVLCTLIVCVCVFVFGLAWETESYLSALYRFLSEVLGCGTVYQRNTCANSSAHGADWQSVCPEGCGKSERGIERQSVREKDEDDGEKKKGWVCMQTPPGGRLCVFFLFLFLSLSILGLGHLTRPDWISVPVQMT